uniref:Cytosolic non-specific dipeptidase-like n=1 Tax=Saccoglossus kowalevskii TaxID=10224 RepID=A0ABM0H1L6_SACKO
MFRYKHPYRTYIVCEYLSGTVCTYTPPIPRQHAVNYTRFSNSTLSSRPSLVSKMAAEFLPKFFSYIDEHQDLYVERLKDAVAIQSVSAWPEKRPEIKKMVESVAKQLETLGGTVELVDIGMQKLPDGTEIPLPPILLGQLGNDPKKKTICIYGHLDVQPAAKSDGWDTEPFVLTEVDGKLYGRGSTDDKGPVLAWLHVIEAYQKLGRDIPVNCKVH